MSKVFGGKASSGKEKASVPVAVRRADIPVDDNIQHEMGWGSHSVESCNVIMHGFGVYEVLLSSTVYVLVDSIFIMNTPARSDVNGLFGRRQEDKNNSKGKSSSSRNDGPSVPMIEKTFNIKYSDIQLFENNAAAIYAASEEDIFYKHHKSGKFASDSIKISLKDGSTTKIKDITFSIFDNSNFRKRLLANWHSYLLRESSQAVERLNLHSNIELTNDYVRETITSIKLAIQNLEIEELEAILDELATDVIDDLELKDAIFKTKQIIVFCIQIIRHCLEDKLGCLFQLLGSRISAQKYSSSSFNNGTSAADLLEHNEILRKYGVNPKDDRTVDEIMSGYREINVSNSSKFTAFDGEEFKNLHNVTYLRLKLARKALKVLVALMINSEAVESRFLVVSGPEPLDIEGWVSIMTIDFQETIMKNFGLPNHLVKKDDLSAIDKNIDLMIRSHDKEIRKSVASILATKYRIHEDKDNQKNTLLRLSSNQGPIFDKALYKSIELAEFANKTNFLALYQSIGDLQYILLYSTYNLTLKSHQLYANTVCDSDEKAVASTSIHSIAMTSLYPSGFVPVGKAFVAQDNWEKYIEDLVIRMSTILDDILTSEEVNRHFNKKLSKIEKSIVSNISTKTLDKISAENNNSNSGNNSSRNSNSSNLNSSVLQTPQRSDSPGRTGGTTNKGFKDMTMLSSSLKLAPKHTPLPPSARKSDRKRRDNDMPPGRRHNSPKKESTSKEFDKRGNNNNSSTNNNNNNNNNIIDSSSRLTPKVNTSFNFCDSPKRTSTSTPKGGDSKNILHLERALTPNRSIRFDFPTVSSKESFSFSPPRNSSVSFANDIDNAYDDDEVEEDTEGKNLLMSYETQEIMLFYCSQVVLGFAVDNAMVRDILGRDLEPYWSSIVSVINLICPNPIMPLLKTTLTPKPGANGVVDAIPIPPGAKKRLSVYNRVETSLPLYGMSETTWELILLAKGAIYDTMEILGNTVNENFYGILDNAILHRLPIFLEEEVDSDSDNNNNNPSSSSSNRRNDSTAQASQRAREQRATYRNNASENFKDRSPRLIEIDQVKAETNKPSRSLFAHRYDSSESKVTDE